MRKRVTSVFAFCVALGCAEAQSQSTPNLMPGQIPTAAQWNSYFAAKQDTLGYTAVRKSGDVMLGVLRSNMPAPSLSSCGTNPTIVGNNQAGTVTMGTGSPSGCTLTFDTTHPWPATPSCQVTWRAANLASMQYTNTMTTLSITQTPTSSNTIDYHCWGLQ